MARRYGVDAQYVHESDGSYYRQRRHPDPPT